MSPAVARRLQPLDAAARDGRLRLVSDGQHFAVVRWAADAWRFPSAGLAPGQPLDFTPTEYQP